MTTPIAPTTTSVPTPQMPFANENGTLSLPWYQFFVAIWNRTGAANGSGLPVNPSGSNQLLSSVSTSVLAWTLLSGANFSTQVAGKILAGPPAGVPATPSFRSLASSDLPNLSSNLAALDGQYPGTTDGSAAVAGNIGEVISSTVLSAAGVVLVSGAASDITSINLGIGDWDIWGSVGLTAASTTTAAWINTVSVTDPGAPNNGAYLLQGAQTVPVISPLGMMSLLLNAPATLFLSVNATLPGAAKAYGFIGARRRR